MKKYKIYSMLYSLSLIGTLVLAFIYFLPKENCTELIEVETDVSNVVSITSINVTTLTSVTPPQTCENTPKITFSTGLVESTLESTNEQENAPILTTEETTENEVESIAEIEEVETESKSEMTLLGNLKITGYVSTGNNTANGDYPYIGGVAMSEAYDLPYGTTIYIEGMGYYTLNDTGCDYGVVDVFCNSEDECYNLTSYLNVYVVNN